MATVGLRSARGYSRTPPACGTYRRHVKNENLECPKQDAIINGHGPESLALSDEQILHDRNLSAELFVLQTQELELLTLHINLIALKFDKVCSEEERAVKVRVVVSVRQPAYEVSPLPVT